jgi:mannose/cellobiose epimerase-like protein (N-acyl-D-glucosamine 2-epimerase family)
MGDAVTPALPAAPKPNYESAAFLKQHIVDVLNFYRPVAFDEAGGFFHYYQDNGAVYNRTHRHLVSATRFVFNWVQAWQHTQDSTYLTWAKHALDELDLRFKNANGDYVWTLEGQRPEDARIMAYGQAFVLLAKSWALRADLCTPADVRAVFDRMNTLFYDADHRAYADERSADGILSAYRGQNANMHMCEACIAAFEATNEAAYLERAITLAKTFTQSLVNQPSAKGADQCIGQIWEHYHTDWQPDWSYNKDNPGDIFKPWGYQTGHQTEWAKLLLQIHAHAPDSQWLTTAQHLHDAAYRFGWDATNGGLVYGYAPDGAVCDSDKYFWVQAESFASAWRLWRATHDVRYLTQYNDTWDWAWRHMVDHTYGAWYRIVDAQGNKLETTKSPAGKVDYHTMGACWDVLRVGDLQP